MIAASAKRSSLSWKERIWRRIPWNGLAKDFLDKSSEAETSRFTARHDGAGLAGYTRAVSQRYAAKKPKACCNIN